MKLIRAVVGVKEKERIVWEGCVGGGEVSTGNRSVGGDGKRQKKQ